MANIWTEDGDGSQPCQNRFIIKATLQFLGFVVVWLAQVSLANAQGSNCSRLFQEAAGESAGITAPELESVWPPRDELVKFRRAFQQAEHESNLRTALVLGGSDGLGGGYAASLAKIGYHVVLVARREQQLARKRQELLPFGRSITTISADLSESSSISLVIDRMKELGLWDDLTMVVAAAGAEHSDAHIEKNPIDGWRMRNIKAVVQPGIIDQIVNRWIEKRHVGKVVVVGSVSGLSKHGVANRRAYSRTNRDFIQYGLDLAKRVYHQSIDVYAVAPGSVDTPGLRSILKTPTLWKNYWKFSQYATVNDVVRDSIEQIILPPTFTPILPAGAKKDLDLLNTFGLVAPLMGGFQDLATRAMFGEL